jgi:beta-N-acetylhexosaminidase
MLTDLQAMLDASQPDLPLESDLTRANWIVFAMLPAEPDIPSFQILSRFLSERPDLFQQKRLVVFAFSAPYYLDATNISKLDAYYGLYSKEPQFVDIAAYLLFRELRPTGASPVSVPGIRYDLNEALFPDPNRAIPLAIDLPPSAVEATPATLEPTPAPQYHIGDMIPLVAGSIQDHNGNPVPDGTPVTFVLTTGVEANSVRQVETTKSGVARTTLSVTSPGAVEIHAESETARSDSLHFDIPSPSGEVVTATPTELPTATITPSPVPPTPQPAETPAPAQPPDRPGLGDWLMAVMISIVIAWSSYRLAALIGQVRWGVRTGFLALIGGLAAYSYLALEMPGSRALLDSSVPRSIFLGTLAGAALGLLIALSWRAIVEIERRRN